jgi:hypothetical protein
MSRISAKAHQLAEAGGNPPVPVRADRTNMLTALVTREKDEGF